jgi:hypothetical protein
VCELRRKGFEAPHDVAGPVGGVLDLPPVRRAELEEALRVQQLR